MSGEVVRYDPEKAGLELLPRCRRRQVGERPYEPVRAPSPSLRLSKEVREQLADLRGLVGDNEQLDAVLRTIEVDAMRKVQAIQRRIFNGLWF